MSPVTRPRRRAPVLDALCAAALDLARAAAQEEAPAGTVGDHLGAVAEEDRVVTHTFAALQPGYRGWVWSVTVARASRARVVTVDEVALLPGGDALVAPGWVPWSDRLRPGDLAPGVLAPTDPDDPRLTNGWSGADDLAGELDPGPLHPVNWEPGIGRARVLSDEGRRDAAHRWYGGQHGPGAAMAKASPGRCSSCGWLLTIGGPLGQMFGVCAHLISPADGRIVSFDHGCGAHSEVQAEATPVAVPPTVIDDLAPDQLDFGHS